MNVLSALMKYADAEPDRACVYYEDGTLDTYGDLAAASGRFARALDSLGVEPGDRIAAKIEKGPTALYLYLATLQVGAVFLPLNSGYTVSEISFFVDDASPVILVCSQSDRKNLKAVLGSNTHMRLETLEPFGGGSLDDLANGCDENREVEPRLLQDLAAILYTSGTTGRPKGAMQSHINLLSNARALQEVWRYDSSDRLIHALPIFHTHGLLVACNLTLLCGASMYFLNTFDAPKIIRLFKDSTVLMGVPTFYVRLLANRELNRDIVRSMRLFISGSAPMTNKTHRAFKERTGREILERYGMTETGMISSNPVEKIKLGSVGKALPEIDIRITDRKNGKQLPAGDIGLVEVKGPNVFLGYWQQPEKTAAEFRDDGFFITGDLGSMDEQGYLNLVGRHRDLVITGGYNVYPKEVEQHIDALACVAESAVIGTPHPDFGEGVVAVVVVNESFTIDSDFIRSSLRRDLAAYKIPKVVKIVRELPRNSMGKVQKNILRDTYAELFHINGKS